MNYNNNVKVYACLDIPYIGITIGLANPKCCHKRKNKKMNLHYMQLMCRNWSPTTCRHNFVAINRKIDLLTEDKYKKYDNGKFRN